MHSRMAAAEASLEGKSGTRSSSGLSGHFGDSGWQFREEKGVTEQPSEQSDASGAAPTGKLKKTAFKLFGGKRSICTLPSLFGGKNRGHGKGVSKKGLSKSKTHDGISEVGYEGAGSGRLRSPSDGGTDFPPPLLPVSQSALLASDANLRSGLSASLLGSSEGFEKKSNGGEKTLFIPRPKKGLKGLFSSIRLHRKNKVVEPEKTELQEWVRIGGTAEEQVPRGVQAVLEVRESSKKEDLTGSDNLQNETLPGIVGNLDESREGGQMVEGRDSEGVNAARAAGGEDAQDVEVDLDGALPDPLHPEDLDSSLPSVPSGDQLNLMFGDVTSLKSFDSFTGCGDIIAEPDIDSIAESSTSAERSRDATKRSSCLVTYQGGGEEMAIPDEIEEYLQQVWEGAVKMDTSYDARASNREVQGVNGSKSEAHLYVEGTRNDPDLLTPHSDQQESAPNSDEGYYDSTTPGPEDEADEVKKDRLPRDSYSGDALYEFYEPDDVLMSPSHGDECWFDRKTSRPEIFGQFLDFSLSGEKDLAQMMGEKSEGMETEEERMAAIQKQLLYWEMQREPVLKHLEMISKEQHLQEKQRNCLSCEQNSPRFGSGDPEENEEWKDRPETVSPEKPYNVSRDPKVHNSHLFQRMENGSDGQRPTLESSALEKSVPYPFYRTHGCHSCPPSEPEGQIEPVFRESHTENGAEPEQAVSFSQALVEFTSSGTLFSSLSESLGSSDSESAFTQNFPALPTMVTFDIVDVEQDGEGECEQHLEMNTEEDIAASFEAFDDNFLPKESFVECDERMYPAYNLNAFQSCNWGVASLPRCLRLQEASGPDPEPLSVCRRSRSLDTESLEFELSGLQVSKNGLKPCELWSKWSGGKKTHRENSLSSPEEREDDECVPSWPGLQNVSYGEELSMRDSKPWNCDPNVSAFQSPWGALKEPHCTPLEDGPSKETPQRPRDDGDNQRMVARPMARPSNLPLQSPMVPHEKRAAHKVGKKFAWVQPLGDADGVSPPSVGLVGSPDKSAMCKPVGVAQGVSQIH